MSAQDWWDALINLRIEAVSYHYECDGFTERATGAIRFLDMTEVPIHFDRGGNWIPGQPIYSMKVARES